MAESSHFRSPWSCTILGRRATGSGTMTDALHWSNRSSSRSQDGRESVSAKYCARCSNPSCCVAGGAPVELWICSSGGRCVVMVRFLICHAGMAVAGLGAVRRCVRVWFGSSLPPSIDKLTSSSLFGSMPSVLARYCIALAARTRRFHSLLASTYSKRLCLYSGDDSCVRTHRRNARRHWLRKSRRKGSNAHHVAERGPLHRFRGTAASAACKKHSLTSVSMSSQVDFAFGRSHGVVAISNNFGSISVAFAAANSVKVCQLARL